MRVHQTATLRGHTDCVCSISFSPDSLTFASGSDDGSIAIWDVSRSKRIHTHQLGNPVTCARYSPDGKSIAYSDTCGRIGVICSSTGHEKWSRIHKAGAISHCVSYSPAGEQIVSVSYDGSVKLWNSATGKRIDVLRTDLQIVNCAAFSPDSRFIATEGSANGSVILWDVERLQAHRTFGEGLTQGHCNAAFSIDFSPDGTYLALGSSYSPLTVWHLDTGEMWAPEGSWSEQGDDVGGAIRAVAFANDSRRLVTAGDDNVVKIWDVRSEVELGQIRGNVSDSRFFSIDVSAKGRTIAAGSSDGTIALLATQQF